MTVRYLQLLSSILSTGTAKSFPLMSSKEEDFACDKFVPQKWRKDVCRNCYQTLRLHEKKTKTISSSSIQSKPPEKTPVTPTVAKFKQSQDVPTVSPSPPQSQQAMVTGSPTKNVAKPGARQPPPPPPRRSSLKSFVPPKPSIPVKPSAPTAIQEEKPAIPDATVTPPITHSDTPTVLSVTASPQNGTFYSTSSNPPVSEGSSTSVERTSPFVPTPSLSTNPATTDKDLSSPKKPVQPLSAESGLLESNPVVITGTPPQTHSEIILQEPLEPVQEAQKSPQEQPQENSELLQYVEFQLPQEVTLEGSSQPSLAEMEVPSVNPLEIEDTSPQENIPEVQVVQTEFNTPLIRGVEVLDEKENNEEEMVLLLSEDVQDDIISPSRLSPSPCIPPPPAPSPAATPITIGVPIPPPPPPLAVINPPILPHVRVLSFPPANIPPPPSPSPPPPPPAFAGSPRDDTHSPSSVSPPNSPIVSVL